MANRIAVLITLAVVGLFLLLPTSTKVVILAVVAAIGIAANAIAFVGMMRGRRQSWMPFAGGLAGVYAVRNAPWPELHGWWWVPLVIDLGTSLFAAGILFAIGTAIFQRRPIPRVGKMRLLLVGGEPTRALGEHDVVIAKTAADAMRIAARAHFDVMLVDYKLADGTGEELVRWAKSAKPNLPIISIARRREGNAALVAAGATAQCKKLDRAQLAHALITVRPEGGQGLLVWRIKPDLAREDRIVAAVLMFMSEQQRETMTIVELRRDDGSSPFAIDQVLDADGVAALIRVGLRDNQIARVAGGDLSIATHPLGITITCKRDCPDAVAFAMHDCELSLAS